MSFITDIVKYGLGQYGIEANGDTPSALFQSAATNFISDQVAGFAKKVAPTETPATTTTPNTNTTSRQVKVELTADQNASIPVVYGEAFVDPILIDAQLTDNNCTMWYAVVLCEATGDIKSTGVDDGEGNITYTQSAIEFREVWLDNKKLVVGSDGVTVKTSHLDGDAYTKDDTVKDLIKIYCYSNGSASPAKISLIPDGINDLHGNAWEYMPGWTTEHTADNLAFALIRIDYSAKNEIKGINKLRFRIRNTMSLPGDVMYDYMTSTRYGAGLTDEEVDY